MNSVGELDPQEVVTELAAEVLGREPPPEKRFAGDPAELVGTYVGRGPEGEIVVDVVSTPDGIALSVDGRRRVRSPGARV